MRAEGSEERARQLETGWLPTADGMRQPEDSTASSNSCHHPSRDDQTVTNGQAAVHGPCRASLWE